MKKRTKEEIERIEYVKANFGKRKEMLLKKNSEAERHFMHLLDKTPFYYIREKCCYDGNYNWCYIDFYIPFYKLGIEIDGKEHNTEKQKIKDKKKSNFLLNERGISIYRITNEECLNMKSVDILGIVKNLRHQNTETPEMAMKRINEMGREQEEQLTQMQGIAPFDVRREIFVYCKLNDKIYRYKNLYMLKRSIMMKYKDIIRAISNNDNIFASNNFIYDFNIESLNAKIERYYDFLWENRKVN